MMRLRSLLQPFLLLAAVAASAQAATSPEAVDRAGSWFTDILAGEQTDEARTARAQRWSHRLEALAHKDSEGRTSIDTWDAAATKALGPGDYRLGLVMTLPKYDPLWDKDNQLISGAVAKYTARMEQLSATTVKEWQVRTNEAESQGALLLAAMTLVAEEELFPEETFSQGAFASFMARYK